MTFSKLFKSAVTALAAVSLAACGSSSTAASASASAAASNVTPAASSSSEGSDEAKDIILAISPDYPPYDTLDDNAEVDGFDVDMMEWVFNWLNQNGYPSYTYQWKQMSFDTIISAVQTGQVDVGVAGFTYDKDRKVLFSDPYYTEYQVAMVPEGSDITSTDQLKGKSIGVQMGTNAERIANSIKDEDPSTTVQAIEDNGIVVETLKAGGVDVAIMGKAVADNYAAAGGFTVLPETLEESGNFVITAEDNQALMDVINKGIDAFVASDDYNTLVSKWFSSGN